MSRIWACIAAGVASPFVRDYIEQLREWGGCNPQDWRCLLPLGHYTVANLIQYTPDPPDRDLFKSLEVIRGEAHDSPNAKGKGDCGTYTACEGTIFAVWGAEIGCRTIAQSPSYDHVFNIVGTGALGVVTLDASPTPTPKVGASPPRSKYWASRDFWLRNLDEWVAWWMRGADESRMPPV